MNVYIRKNTYITVKYACALFFFQDEGDYRNILYSLKYGGNTAAGEHFGKMLGRKIASAEHFADVDTVIPVPLHPFKLLKRGYNQSTYLAEGMAKAMGTTIDTRAARRIRNNPSQARRGARDRWENVDELFRIVRPERLRGKHILVVDDVLTSGATLTTLLKEIIRTVPDCRISVATLAVSKHITPLGK